MSSPGHEWTKHEREGWSVCSRCGMVRNYDRETTCSGSLPKIRQRGNDQMRLLAGLPLPPDVVAKLREADRLRKLFDDAGAGEHDVLALIDYYQEVTLDAEARLEAIRKLLAEENGHECVGEGICLACRIAKACVAPTGGDK